MRTGTFAHVRHRLPCGSTYYVDGRQEEAVMAGDATQDPTRDTQSGHKTDPADNPPPGPTDHGREGGIATREVAPELVESDDD
jgi:hypothetical protein